MINMLSTASNIKSYIKKHKKDKCIIYRVGSSALLVTLLLCWSLPCYNNNLIMMWIFDGNVISEFEKSIVTCNGLKKSFVIEKNNHFFH